LKGEPIKVFNHGKMQRDFTYVDDIVEGIVRIQDVIPAESPDWRGVDPSMSHAPYRIYNIGNNQPIELTTFIDAIEKACGREAEKEYLPMQPGDVPRTYADIDTLTEAVGFQPSTDIYTGMQRFVDWFRGYKGL